MLFDFIFLGKRCVNVCTTYIYIYTICHSSQIPPSCVIDHFNFHRVVIRAWEVRFQVTESESLVLKEIVIHNENA